MFSAQSPTTRNHAIDRLSAAECVATLLGRVNIDGFPLPERIAVANLQVAAIEEWLAVYLEARAGADEPRLLS